VRPDVQKGFLIWNLIPKHSHRTKVDVASSPLGVRPLLLSINSLPQEDKRSHTTSKLSLDTTQPRQLKAKPQKHPEIEQASPSPSILVLGDNEMTSTSLFIPVHSQFLPKGRTTSAGYFARRETTSMGFSSPPSFTDGHVAASRPRTSLVGNYLQGCPLQGLGGCATTTTSDLAKFLGLPIRPPHTLFFDIIY
jgi:hypothetical protein